ncbi:MAG: hypothetical protein COW01_09620 [Bdellovibrionales bacterium CG12_big_fil_rev_8_21_14_0_65_38_15]|nr:MAG: hypothetical protein COW79_15750 [Bdellovibrionales bacterium CG22_combo_CG10-13_8_21_14_all_38_13]PIQ54785.1 MAG: hypothetical protein COW01_09620 [Bdellovibrionales bacterium CG12_big_fil_rev_8_21_14_0_65_38_15]PIR31446.1 MAG: hypothetical protein COV38_00245 [Bdellovibrionales bacterium CG11_big_fil_rev_8_21_14_0_20_38_13]
MKKKIIEELLLKVRTELSALESASKSAKAYVTDGDIKSDGKYDTRGIEAGYLAGAQEKRVEELKLELQMLEEIPIRDFSKGEEVGIGSLVDLTFKGQTRRYFIAPTAGGTMLNIDGTPILVISTFSPIGDAVFGTSLGEEFELETPQELRHYKVEAIS